MTHEQTFIASMNTDGMLIAIAPGDEERVAAAIKSIEDDFGLEFETTKVEHYRRLNVNTYQAILANGKVKGKGSLNPERNLESNPNRLIVPQAILESDRAGTPIEQTVADAIARGDMGAFCTVATTNGTHLVGGVDMGNVMRVYYSTDAAAPEITIPPTGKAPAKRVHKGCKPIVDISTGIPDDLDVDRYLDEIRTILDKTATPIISGASIDGGYHEIQRATTAKKASEDAEPSPAPKKARGEAVNAGKPPSCNRDALEVIFGDALPEAYVVGSRVQDQWGGGAMRYNAKAVEGDCRGVATYASISTHAPDADGVYHRSSYNVTATYGFLFDDVGTKVGDPRERGFGEPTMILESSPGNRQFFYRLAEPLTESAQAQAIIDASIEQGFNEPGSGGLNRVFRLPFGANVKAKHLEAFGDEGFPVRLEYWKPDNKYSPDELAAWLGIENLEEAAKAIDLRGELVGGDAVAHPVARAFDELGTLRKRRASGWVEVQCPNYLAHTDQIDDDGAGIFIEATGDWKFRCHHGSCAEFRSLSVWQWLKEKGFDVPPPTMPGTSFAGFDLEAIYRARGERFEGGVVIDNATGEVFDPKSRGDRQMVAAPRMTFIENAFDETPAADWVIEGFIDEGVWAVAGRHGIGKSTNLAPLVLCVAGLATFNDGRIHTRYPRPVIYVTEAEGQIRRSIRAQLIHRGIDPKAANDSIKVAPARRLPVAQLVAEVVRLIEALPPHNEPPLIVFDTHAASFEIESENDNAQQSRVLAALKVELYEKRLCSVWVIGHVSKAAAATGDNFSFRGAGAMEGDANGTAFFRVDKDLPDLRIMQTEKIRNDRDYQEIAFRNVATIVENRPNRHGDIVEQRSIVVEPEILTAEDREEAAAVIKASNADRQIEEGVAAYEAHFRELHPDALGVMVKLGDAKKVAVDLGDYADAALYPIASFKSTPKGVTVGANRETATLTRKRFIEQRCTPLGNDWAVYQFHNSQEAQS